VWLCLHTKKRALCYRSVVVIPVLIVYYCFISITVVLAVAVIVVAVVVAVVFAALQHWGTAVTQLDVQHRQIAC
jgi:hypothetical protein